VGVAGGIIVEYVEKCKQYLYIFLCKHAKKLNLPQKKKGSDTMNRNKSLIYKEKLFF
jgi:hypothetical protein